MKKVKIKFDINRDFFEQIGIELISDYHQFNYSQRSKVYEAREELVKEGLICSEVIEGREGNDCAWFYSKRFPDFTLKYRDKLESLLDCFMYADFSHRGVHSYKCWRGSIQGEFETNGKTRDEALCRMILQLIEIGDFTKKQIVKLLQEGL